MSDSERSTSRGGISRRMLTGGGALLPFALLNLKTDAAVSPDPVLPLYQEWQRLQVTVTELCHRCQDLEEDLIRRSATRGTQHHTEGQANLRAASGRATFEPVPELASVPVNTMPKAGFELTPVPQNALGWDELESLRAEEGATWEELQKAADALFRAEAQTLAGVAIKISLIAQMCSTGPTDKEFPVPQLCTTLADIQRLDT